MVSKGKKTISVDSYFFNNTFEKERKKLQKQLGIINLSQVKFTRMIKGLKIIPINKNIINIKNKRSKKRNDLFKI